MTPNEPHVARQQFWPIVALSIAAFAFNAGLLGYTLWLDYSNRIVDSKENARFVANLVASQARATIAELDKMLDGIALQLRLQRLKTTPSLDEEAGEYLKAIMSSYDSLMDVLILDANGVIVQWTGDGDPPAVSDRAYARVHLDNPRSGLFVGEPLLSKVHTGQWFFAISEAMRDTEGQLQFILVAIVDIELFRSLLADIELPPDSTLALIRESGYLITREPDHSRHVGTHVNDEAQVWNGGTPDGDLEIVSPVDHVDRIVGYSLLEDSGIGVFSTMARDTVLADWYRLAYLAVAILVSAAIVLVLLNHRIYWDQRRVVAQQKRLADLARIDELTGLYNRRHVMEVLEAELGRSRRYGTPLSLFMMDIDHFKAVNDRCGHDCGDVALVQIAEAVRKTMRGDTAVGRYGGDEFLGILPVTTKEEAINVAERIRRTVECESVSLGKESMSLTVSIGVASCDPEIDPILDFVAIKKADEALYRAKGEGRNCVVAAAG